MAGKAVVSVADKTWDAVNAVLRVRLFVDFDVDGSGSSPIQHEETTVDFSSIPAGLTDTVVQNWMRDHAIQVVAEAFGQTIVRADVAILPG
jgi:hypothetical protein